MQKTSSHAQEIRLLGPRNRGGHGWDSGGGGSFLDVPVAASSDLTPWTQTQIRSKPQAERLQNVLTNVEAAESQGHPQVLTWGCFSCNEWNGNMLLTISRIKKEVYPSQVLR